MNAPVAPSVNDPSPIDTSPFVDVAAAEIELRIIDCIPVASFIEIFVLLVPLLTSPNWYTLFTSSILRYECEAVSRTVNPPSAVITAAFGFTSYVALYTAESLSTIAVLFANGDPEAYEPKRYEPLYGSTLKYGPPLLSVSVALQFPEVAVP